MVTKLTKKDIKRFNKLYLSEITTLNKDIELSSQFWDKQIPSMTLKKYLYFSLHFFKNNICATPMHYGPIDDDHITSIPVLEKLCKLGVITLQGQCSNKEQRSFLEFIIICDKKDYLVDLLTSLYNNDFQVFAQIHKNTYTNNIILFKSKCIDIFNFDADDKETVLNYANEYTEVTRNYTHCHFRCCTQGLKYLNHVNINTDNYVLSCTIFSNRWDNKEADKVLYDLLISSN